MTPLPPTPPPPPLATYGHSKKQPHQFSQIQHLTFFHSVKEKIKESDSPFQTENN